MDWQQIQPIALDQLYSSHPPSLIVFSWTRVLSTLVAHHCHSHHHFSLLHPYLESPPNLPPRQVLQDALAQLVLVSVPLQDAARKVQGKLYSFCSDIGPGTCYALPAFSFPLLILLPFLFLYARYQGGLR